MEKFDWPRIHKHEENLENDATERVENYIWQLTKNERYCAGDCGAL